jgi:hypothetical protein
MHGIATCHGLNYSPGMTAFIFHLVLDKSGVEEGLFL